MTSAQIRQQFLDFFVQKHGHRFVPSSPVVPHDDPTLLFTNAGMNQFKPIFLGLEKRDYSRAANTQKCIRAGGKHNDLDDVGRSRRHHTFFEMLGNWSFGDYFKRGAIEMAWELLTKVWKLDPTRLHVSCYEGDEQHGVPRDTEAADIWRQIANLPDDRIHYFGKDNFWEMGDTGPCGPCTEIYIDRTSDKSGGRHVNGDNPEVMEIWNLVFIQYNRNADRTLTPLPARHVDTGMGFERICQVLQNKQDNYGIDLWDPFFAAISRMSSHTYTGQYPRTNAPDPAAEAANPQLRTDIAFRVIADHLRCLVFALTDGATPSNEGRGYVLRRILRRAVRFGRQQLDLRQPFLHQLVPVVVDSMGSAFPELKRDPQRVVDIIQDEEVSFGRTLDRGIALFDEAAQRSHKTGRISGEDAFKLHDTYGFPVDLTQVMATERGMSVDIADYERLMDEARQRARGTDQNDQANLTSLTPAALSQLQQQGIAPTDDAAKFSTAPVSARVLAIWTGSELVDQAGASAGAGEVAVILDQTCFYAEMGGQVGDSGQLRTAGGSIVNIQTTRAAGGYVLHIGSISAQPLRVGDQVTATLSSVRRLTEKNHTATHLANWALRQVLGDGVQQKGSLVDPDKLRFDFSHTKALSETELTTAQQLVQAAIEKKMPVHADTAAQEQALKINGLRAVFGEKYPPRVRVVSIGASLKELLALPQDARWREFSIEFCGGTHLQNTAEIENFLIISEESVSKGVRRITAFTGPAARQAQTLADDIDQRIAAAGQSDDEQLSRHVTNLTRAIATPAVPLLAKRRAQAAIAELHARVKALGKAEKKQETFNASAIADELMKLAAGHLIVAAVDGASDDQLRSVVDSIKTRQATYAIMLACPADDKAAFVAAVSDDLIKKGLKAGDWVRQTAQVAGGGGGGRPNLAQGSGKDPTQIAAALDQARQLAQVAQ